MNKNLFAKTPPMGWNSYDYYDTTVNEEQIRANADFMAAHLKAYGWEYVVVDIEWYANDAGTKRDQFQYIPFGDLEMDEYGRLQPSPARFPSSAGGKGFGPLAEYVHSLGLKFGIHIMRGIPRKAAQEHLPVMGSSLTADMVADSASICGWNPDMYGVRNTEAGQAWYDSLIEMYAQWGVDFIKCDDICDSWLYRGDNFNGWFETRMLHRAIEKSGREIVLSLSPGPAHIDRAWEYCKYANMWRITDDFWDNWELLLPMFWRCELWQDHVKEGCFPDCDMLPLGKVGKGFGEERDTRLTREEQKTMMTLWSFFRSPMMVGAELTKLDDWTLSLLQNKELLCRLKASCKGEQICRDEKLAVWKSTDAEDGSVCIALFNLQDEPAQVSVALSEAADGLTDGAFVDLWDNSRGETKDGRLTAVVAAHGVKAVKLL
ncbi:MAG: glycoside hydrolase family 27 protein [Eubacteriales bacterium]|nr:glycoside hydrolase family 27 protein [Eubacteriales bacterium]